jgi:hypothetical protein
MDRVSFTPRSAQRIARVVRSVENARPPGVALEFRTQIIEADKKVFRVATYTGAWSIGSAKTVTFKNQTNTPNTVSATNLFFPVASTAAGSRDCAVARDGTAWYLIDVVFSASTAVFCSSTAEVAITAVIATGQITYITGVSASLNTTSCTISVLPATATASVIMQYGSYSFSVMQGTFTSRFLTGFI